jgi:type I restriction enzyme R subunit
MWLTGFDVECLSALYIDKPMKAHTLMQAIARANRVYPGKDFGLIVDYNGMLKSLREALAQYALGDEGSGGGEEIVAPIEERVRALLAAIEETEAHLRSLGFDPDRLLGSKGFPRIHAIADGVDAVYTSDESKRRFEILARQVFIRFKALIMEPAAFTYAERHDNIEAIYKKLEERRDTADVTELLKELHRIVNEAIRTQREGSEVREERYDLSRIDLEKLRDEFAKKVRRKKTALQEIRQLVEDKLALMLQRNPQRMDYYKRYSEIVADYNREKDRVTIEETFAKLVDLANSLDAEQRRAVEEGLSEDELAFFDLLKKEKLSKADRERVKQASKSLLDSVRRLIAPLENWTAKEQTQAEVKVFILDHLFQVLPTPPFSEAEKQAAAQQVYQYVWAQSNSGSFARPITV